MQGTQKLGYHEKTLKHQNNESNEIILSLSQRGILMNKLLPIGKKENI